MFMKKWIPIIVSVAFLSSCVSMYYQYEKYPCSNMASTANDGIKRILLNCGYKAEVVEVNDEYMIFIKDRKIKYDQINKAFVQTKKMLRGKRYRVVIELKNRAHLGVNTYDFEEMKKLYSFVECRAGIPSSPEDQEKQEEQQEEKYDQLLKLMELRDKGGITEEEYEQEKRKILNLQ